MIDDPRTIRPPALSRRAFGLAAFAALGALAGCGTTRTTSSSATSSSAGSSSAGTSTSAGFSPVTISHAYGQTTIEQVPATVVSAGYTEQDYLLALGITPAAVTDWYGDHPFGVWPWAKAALGSAQPKLLNLNDGFQFVEIAALEPDLIVALNSGMEQSDYDKLSKIAPTLPPLKSEDLWFAPWNQMFTPIAQAVGRADEGSKVQDDLTARFAAEAAAHPSFNGAKAIFLQNAVYDGSLIAYQQGLSTDFLTDLGFQVPSEINAFIREGEQAYIPVEQIDVLNAADVLIWATETDGDQAALEKVPGFTSLKAVKDGRSIYTGGTLSGAIYFTSPLSLPYLLDTLVPMLADAMES